jgi:putative DNA primase/helicase
MSHVTWRRVRSSDRCPICGQDAWCAFGESVDERTGEVESGFVKCMRHGPGDAPETPGWAFERAIKAAAGSKAFKWVPPGHAIRSPLSEAERQSILQHASKQREQREKLRALRARKRRAYLGMVWGEAATHTYLDVDAVSALHGAVFAPSNGLTELGSLAMAWFASRGIDLADVGLTRSLRVHPAAIDTFNQETKRFNTALAMVAKISGMPPAGDEGSGKPELRALHCTYLEERQDATGAKIAKRNAEAGEARKKHGLVEGGVVRLSEAYGTGILIVGEGIETTMSAWISAARVYQRVAGWAALDADSMRGMELPAKLFGAAWQEGSPAPQPEQRGTLHTVLIAADLDANMAGQAAAIATAQRIMRSHPWITVEVCLPTEASFPELVERRGGVLVPKGGAKGVDWNDVLMATDVARTWAGLISPAGPERAIKIEENVERRANWLPSHAWGSKTVTPQTPVPSRKSKAVQEQDDQAASDEGGGAGGGDGGGDVAVGGQDDGGEPPAAKGDVGLFIEADPLWRARQFLLECMSPPKGQRANGAFMLRRYKGEWWEFEGRSWEVVGKELLSARVMHWMAGKMQFAGSGKKARRFAPQSKDVEEVLKALCVDTIVEVGDAPCWVFPSFDAKGDPRWGSAVRGVRHRETPPDAKNIIAFKNCLFRADRWAQGVIECIPHSPLWFSPSVLPFELPIAELQEAMKITAEAGHDRAKGGVLEFVRSRCPEWHKFLAQISDNSEDWQDCLQEWAGYILTHSQVMQKLLVIQGPPRAGKGIIEDVLSEIVGKHNVVSTSLNDVCNPINLWTFVGRPLAIMSDAHVGKFTDPTLAVETIKKLTGEGTFTLRRLYTQDFMTSKFPTKILITCNDMPGLMDNSMALAGRIVLLPLKHSFLGKEDRSLKPRLLAEAPGIMLWALVGLQRLWQNIAAGAGFTEPEESSLIMKEVARAQSPVHAFSEDNLFIQAGAEVWVDDVYARYVKWCEEEGNRSPMRRETLGRLLKPLHPMVDVKQAVRIKDGVSCRERKYVGMRLVDRPSSGASSGSDGPSPGGVPWETSSNPTGGNGAASAASALFDGGLSVQ